MPFGIANIANLHLRVAENGRRNKYTLRVGCIFILELAEVPGYRPNFHHGLLATFGHGNFYKYTISLFNTFYIAYAATSSGGGKAGIIASIVWDDSHIGQFRLYGESFSR